MDDPRRYRPEQIPVRLVFTGALLKETNIGSLLFYFDNEQLASAFGGAAQRARDVCAVFIEAPTDD